MRQLTSVSPATSSEIGMDMYLSLREPWGGKNRYVIDVTMDDTRVLGWSMLAGENGSRQQELQRSWADQIVYKRGTLRAASEVCLN